MPFRGRGLQPGISEGDWQTIRKMAYEGRGGVPPNHLKTPGFEPVLDFWFGAGEPKFRQQWFTKDAAFDEHVRVAFFTTYERAAAGALDD